MILELGRMWTDPETGNVLRQVGALTMMVKGRFDQLVPHRAVLLVKDRVRIGREVSAELLAGYQRFSAQLWDAHHQRWAKRKSFALGHLLGAVREDDPGLAEMGIAPEPRVAAPPKLIAVGM